MRIVISVMLLLALASLANAENIAVSGLVEVDLDQLAPTEPALPYLPTSNLLVNPGFETGVISPWYSENWTVSSEDTHSGDFAGRDIGNYFIQQDFAPTNVSDITAVSVWMKQPEVSISSIVMYYQDGSSNSVLLFLPDGEWNLFDLSELLLPTGYVTGLRIWGYSGGGPDPDLTFIDDVTIEYQSETPITPSLWGTIKTLYR